MHFHRLQQSPYKLRHRIFDRQPVKYFIGFITGQILSPVKRPGLDRSNIRPYECLIFDRPPP